MNKETIQIEAKARELGIDYKESDIERLDKAVANLKVTGLWARVDFIFIPPFATKATYKESAKVLNLKNPYSMGKNSYKKMNSEEIAKKVLSVVESCKTLDQLEVAFKYFKLWRNKYNSTKSPDTKLMRVEAECTGFFIGVLTARDNYLWKKEA